MSLDSTAPVYALTSYTYCEAPLAGTAQYSSLDDPTTTESEGFGLMFYNARWYDPVTGRFAQADSIVPAGAQGLDRYAYVNNNPVNFSDPSGHRCQPENECDTPHGDAYLGLLVQYMSSSLSLSKEGLQFIKDQEGFDPIPYNDGINPDDPYTEYLYHDHTGKGKGYCTVGWGHVIHNGPCIGNAKEKAFTGLSPEEYEKILMRDVAAAEAAVKARIKVPLTQSQYDALVSLFFNWGLYDTYPTKVNLINAGRYGEAGIHFLLGPVTSNGAVLQSLEKRRYAEAEMFLRGYDIVLPELTVYLADYEGAYHDTLDLYYPSK